jgi:hypothetical protein
MHCREKRAQRNSFIYNSVLPLLYHCKRVTISAKWVNEGGTILPLWCLIQLKRFSASFIG